MGNRFDYFVVFAEMRTGSNFLEENLNQFPGISCQGEVFNPNFFGGPKREEMFGLTIKQRNDDPISVLALLKSQPENLNGFRLFHDHDQRILTECVQDEKCAKIILTRNPIDSYVSREIVRQTQQWRLGDLKSAKSAKITFDEEEFSAHFQRVLDFQLLILKALQKSGQTAFYLAYEDIPDVEVINGLARFLGLSDVKKKPATKTKKQNPQPLEEKILNFPQMQKSLGSLDYFQINSVPNFEPRRGAAIPNYLAAVETPLIFAPIPAGPTLAVSRWLADLDGVDPSELIGGFNQKTLRHWKRKIGDHRTFTVPSHPVKRLHNAFVDLILNEGPDSFVVIRQALRKRYDLPIPASLPDKSYNADAHRKAFLAFAEFVRGNLNGQTNIRVDPAWASQVSVLQGISQFVSPDLILREDELEMGLFDLAERYSTVSPTLVDEIETSPVALSEIYNAEVEAAVKAAYQRDYMMFGFGRWKS